MSKRSYLAIALVFLFFILLAAEVIPDDFNGEWWDAKWHYRVKLEINSSTYERVDWPIEYEINFTALLAQSGVSGTFDINSTRVFEYDSSGNLLYEVPSQFDIAEDYDASTNAHGTLVFLMNGTTSAGQVRYYYVYFDIIENGEKNASSYDTDLNYSWDGEEINVSNFKITWYIDTLRGENTSGIYRVIGESGEMFITPDEENRTLEYVHYTNGTYNFSFDLRNNASFFFGPVRLIIIQKGNETFWNDPENKTNMSTIMKKYVFYSKNTWIKIIQNITATSPINRSSTPSGALAFDVGRGWTSYVSEGNPTDPGSWYWAGATAGGIGHVGIINLNESVPNFYANESLDLGRIGIEMNETIFSSISQTAVLHFNDTEAVSNQVSELRDRLLDPEKITIHPIETWVVIGAGTTEYMIYNRNETVEIKLNVTDDLYNLTKNANATFDMGTGEEDDETIILNEVGYQNGYHIFNGSYNLSNNATEGIWNITFKMYDSNNYYLNQTWKTFNVTTIYYTNLTVLTPIVFTEEIVNASLDVKNYRQDKLIPGATINCTYNSTQISQDNITDYNNGTYFISFNAPSSPGVYTLNCSATKNGNIGWDLEEFTAQATNTKISITPKPENYTAGNVTWYNDESFYLNVTLNNVANGTAYDTNITLQFPQNITANTSSESCGDIGLGGSCTRYFLITIFNKTRPGNYSFNVTAEWRNPDNSTDLNRTYVNVTVLSNPLIEVPETLISNIIAPGKEKTIGNFTVNSIGNDNLTNIQFSVSGFDSGFTFEFIPTNISNLPPGQTDIVQINVTVNSDHPTGVFTGMLNITTGNNGYDNLTINITVSGTNLTIEKWPESFTADNITWFGNQTFILNANTTNIGNVTAYYANITLSLPPNFTANTTNHPCGNLTPSSTCYASFLITIKNGTAPGNYYINVSSLWEDIEIGARENKTNISVEVTSNPLIDIPETNISSSVDHGTEKTIGSITVRSIGNDIINGINFNVSGFENMTFEFIPNITNLSAGAVQVVNINVTVPLGHDPGNYTGILNVTTSDDGYDNLTINITVPVNRTWYMTPTYCIHAKTPVYGKVCDVLVNNTGNIYINFTINPPSSNQSMVNYTWTNETNFTVEKISHHIFSVWYNVTGHQSGYDNATYNVTAVQTSKPAYQNLTIVLSPEIEAEINVSIEPNITQQFNNVYIYANITDKSGTGLEWVKVNVTAPNGSLYSTNMRKIYEEGYFSKWEIRYPNDPINGTWGSSALKGNYSVQVITKDNTGVITRKNSSFYLYPKLLSQLEPDKNIYYRGDSGSFYYRAFDLSGSPIGNVNVTVKIKDPNNRSVYIISGDSYITDSNGEIGGTLFIISSGAALGNYTLTSNSSYYDSPIGMTITNVTNKTFEVKEYELIYAALGIPDPLYKDKTMPISVFVMNSEHNPIDPSNISISIYYTEGYGLQLWRKLTIENMTRNSTGFYTYSEVLSNVLTGSYLAVLKVTYQNKEAWDLKAFRIVSGGPYDVWVNLLKHEVIQGEYLPFQIYIENKGDVGHEDVNVTWWVSDGQIWDSGSGAVNVPAHSNVTYNGSAFIYLTQPFGMYYLNARVLYDPSQPAVISNATFVVTTGVPKPPEGGGGGKAAGEAAGGPPTIPKPKIEITKYPSEITTEIGWVKYPTIEIKNTGEKDLKNVMISISGIPAGWFTAEPQVIDLLKINESAVIRIKLLVPNGTRAGEYIAEVLVGNVEAKDQKRISILVFTSREELVAYELKKLKTELQKFKDEVEYAKRDGKDVSGLKDIINATEEQINIAEDFFNKKMFDEAISAIYTGWNLINKGRDMLVKAPFIKPVFIPVLPEWAVPLIVVMLIIIIILLISFKKLKARFDRFMKHVRYPEAKSIVTLMKKEVESEALINERERILKLLKLLETERNEGLISETAYQELKKKNEERLKIIESKIK